MTELERLLEEIPDTVPEVKEPEVKEPEVKHQAEYEFKPYVVATCAPKTYEVSLKIAMEEYRDNPERTNFAARERAIREFTDFIRKEFDNIILHEAHDSFNDMTRVYKYYLKLYVPEKR